MDNFVHLHGHSDYSSLDGACSVDDIIDRAVKLNQPAIAITEHGNVDSALKLYKKCKERKIKPILGCEFYLAEEKLTKKSDNYHITVLCKSYAGWKNLLKLTKIASVSGFYYKPRIDIETLEKHREGLIVLSGCLQGFIAQSFLNGQKERAAGFVERMKTIFGDDFYIEIQNHGIDKQQQVMPFLLQMGRDHNVKLVATNDYHYITQEDWVTQEILLCESMKRPFNLHKKQPKEFYIKTREEMEKVIPDKSALDNTIEIANKVDIEFPEVKYLLPEFQDGILEAYIRSGKRMHRDLFPNPIYEERLEKELSVIKAANLTGYFLTVHDFMAHSRLNDIMTGPGRGSVGGCLVSYLLGITTVDPIKYDLMFSRFYNAGRKNSLPDIDIDFAARDIDKVLSYIESRYKYDNICHIGTFNTYAPKGAIKAICRVFEVPFKDANRLTDLIDSKAKSLKDELKTNDKVKEAYRDTTPLSGYLQFKDIFDYATRIEGLISHKGVHAAGIIISPIPLDDIIPVRKEQNSKLLVSCWEMKDIEAIGLVKYDFLRLDNLDAIKETLTSIKKRLKDIPTEGDSNEVKRAYKVIAKTNNCAIFQLSSNEGSRIANRIKPVCIEDIAVAITLNRPGCINTGIHNKYLDRKDGIEEVDYPHPMLQDILKDTYGLMIYQEQIMQICMKMSNFSEIEADSIRKAMGKKDEKLMKSMKEKFISGAESNKVTKSKAEKIWKDIYEFSEYAFNHSHAVGYAYISYYTAYLKANHKAEYMCAVLNTATTDQDKLREYLNECKNIGVDVRPPSATKSSFGFTVVDGQILYGLKGIKGLGDENVTAIIENRKEPYKDIFDLINRNKINSNVLASLAYSGALDDFGYNRATLIYNLEFLTKTANYTKKLEQSKKRQLFEVNHNDAINKRAEFSIDELAQHEFDTIQAYVSVDPLARYVKWMEDSLDESESMGEGDFVSLGGYVQTIESKESKAGNMYVTMTVYTTDKTVRVLAFKDKAAETVRLVAEHRAIWLRGTYKEGVILLNNIGRMYESD